MNKPTMICVGRSQLNVNPPGFDVLHVIWDNNEIPMLWKQIDYPWHPVEEIEDELSNYIKDNLEHCYEQAITKVDDSSWILRMEYPTNISAGADNDSQIAQRLADVYKPLIDKWLSSRK